MSKTPIKANRKYNSSNFNQISSAEHQDLQNYRLCIDQQEKQQETRYPIIHVKNSNQNLLSSINGGYKENNAQIGYGIQSSSKYTNANKTGGNSLLAESSKMIFSQKPQNKKSSNSLRDESTNEEMINSSAGFQIKNKKYEEPSPKPTPHNGDIPNTTTSLINLFNKFNSGNSQGGKEAIDQQKKIDMNIYANSPFIIRNNKSTKEDKQVEDFFLNSPLKSFKEAQSKVTAEKPQENLNKDDRQRLNENTETKKVNI